MITSFLHKNNRLIRKTILRTYPGSFTSNLTITIALMVDTLLAGAMLGQSAIAAVAIGLPALGIAQALTQTIISGTAIKMAVYAGRNDREKMNSVFSLGVITTLGVGTALLLACLFLANVLTKFFGGAGNPQVAAQAALYLKASSVCIVMSSLNTLMYRILNLYGCQKDMTISGLIGMGGNLFFSILYIQWLPSHLDIMGLGLGTWNGGILAAIYSFCAIKHHKIPLKFRLKSARAKEIPGILRQGLPTTSNSLMDSVVAGIINNLIVVGFHGDTTALSVYTAVKSVVSFADTSLKGIQTSIAPLLGILYGGRDRNGLIQTIKEGFKVGIVASSIWCVVIFFAMPIFAKMYGMSGNAYFQTGVIIGLVTTPIWLAVYILTQVSESTEKATVGLLFSSLPDSVLYPLMLGGLLPILKYDGIWIAYNCCAIPLLAGLYLIRSIRNRSFHPSWDRTFALDRSLHDNVPVLDISIPANNTDVSGISEKVHHFLIEEGTGDRTAYMTSLCLEELAADFVEHTVHANMATEDHTIMDIKVFSDQDSLKVVIRNMAPSYNPLDFPQDDETLAKTGVKLVQKISRRIEYTYVFRLNIVTIELDK